MYAVMISDVKQLAIYLIIWTKCCVFMVFHWYISNECCHFVYILHQPQV